jgi:hypothetical protein
MTERQKNLGEALADPDYVWYSGFAVKRRATESGSLRKKFENIACAANRGLLEWLMAVDAKRT